MPTGSDSRSVLHRGLRTIAVLVALAAVLFSYRPSGPSHKAAIVEHPEISDSLGVDSDWIHVSTSSDGINTFKKEKSIDGLHSFRGTAVVDVHISLVLGSFCNVSEAVHWIDMLKSMTKYSNEIESTGSWDIIHQWFDLPWPVADRDLVMRRQWFIDHRYRNITVMYRSIVDPRIPDITGVIRAHSARTVWRFQAVPNPNYQAGATFTRIEIETILDSKGSLPAFLSNYIQRGYPKTIIGALVALATRNISAPDARFLKW